MGLENTNVISGLNTAWPLGTDARSEGDDHLRLIKRVLKSTFTRDGKPLYGFVDRTLVSSGAWTKPADIVALEAWVIAGGGGSTGCNATAAGQSAAGGGGGGGGVVWARWSGPQIFSTVNYTVGVGGASPSWVGADGGNSQFMHAIAYGGPGGGAKMAAGSTFAYSGRGGSASGTITDVNVQGRVYNSAPGEQGVRGAHGAVAAVQGNGGFNMFVMPRYGVAVAGGQVNGNDGFSPGGGATGGAQSGNAAIPAGQGAFGGSGMIYLREWY